MILSIADVINIKHSLGRIGIVSGGYDPIHPGHISNFAQGKKYCDTLIVVVNGDWFLTQKKGVPFMPLADRCKVVDSIRYVDITIPFEVVGDMTVCLALDEIKPDYFFKGGDRNGVENIPEWDTCFNNNIAIITGVGADKVWSSSNYLKNWSNNRA